MDRPCLYCGDAALPKSREHVLQAAFGTTLTLDDDVCERCNVQTFSPLDTSLVQFVRSLACHGHPDVTPSQRLFQGPANILRDDVNSVWTSVRLDQRIRPSPFEQMIQLGGGRWHVVLDPNRRGSDEERLRRFLEELRVADAPTITTLVIPDAEPPVESAVIRSAPGRFVVRGSSEQAAQELRSKIVEGKLAPQGWQPFADPVTSRTQPGPIRVRAFIPHGQIQRAIAKTAMNFVCHVLGPEIARQRRFYGIREFAVTEYADDRPSPVVIIPPDESILGIKEFAQQICPGDHHALTLDVCEDGLLVLFVLYQQALAFVLVSEESPADDPFALALFNYKTKLLPTITRDRSAMPELDQALRWARQTGPGEDW